MAWMETKNNTIQVKSLVENELEKRYSMSNESGHKMFHSDQYGDFSICALGEEDPWNFLVISYENDGEDGDGFYPAEYESIDSLVADIIAEIENP